MYGCVKYFRERYMAASLNMSNLQIEFCTRVMAYTEDKMKKAQLHRVQPMGTHEQRFEVACKDRIGRGVHRERVVQEFFFLAGWYSSLLMYEAKPAASTMLACDCCMRIVWSTGKGICFTILLKGNSLKNLVAGDTWGRSEYWNRSLRRIILNCMSLTQLLRKVEAIVSIYQECYG